MYASQGHSPDFMVRAGTRYLFVKDQLGSIRMVVDAVSGSIAQRIDYDEFGRVLSDSNPGFQPFGFAGGLYDHNTGLVRFGARDYDAELGRWTAKDPILFNGGSMNLFNYVQSDPINLIDDSGTGPVVGGICSFIVGAIYTKDFRNFLDLKSRSESLSKLISKTNDAISRCPDAKRLQQLENILSKRNAEAIKMSADLAEAFNALDAGGAFVGCVALAYLPSL